MSAAPLDVDEAPPEEAPDAAAPPSRWRQARPLLALGIVLIVLGACLVALGAFVLSRGMPGECGGDAPACPPGSVAGMLGAALSLFLLLPLGVALAGYRRPEIASMSVALVFGGIAIGVFVSRFVADPITAGTSSTWWWTAITGTIALLAAARSFSVVGRAEPDPPPG